MTNKGIIVVNKEPGYTSRDVVNILSKKWHIKKMGHTGTLDPIASGVLVICFGKYTKLVEALTSQDKTYIAEIKLGIKTDTLDITGNVLEKRDFNLKKETIENVLNSFKGLYHMEVPAFSAIKVNGHKLYEYARKGEKVELPRKDVNIYDIKLLDFQDDIIKFKVKVEKGTYIRSLIRDICAKLQVIGTMNSLVRVRQGNFKIEDAYTLEAIEKGNYKILDIRDVLNVREYELPDDLRKKVINGNELKLNYKEPFIIFKTNGEARALYHKVQDIYKCYILF